MVRNRLRSSVANVGLALREPEEFAARWNDGRCRYPPEIWLSLLLTAMLGTSTYGMTMGLLSDDTAVLFEKGLACTIAAGMAWTISLPTLYILNSMAGSRLSMGSTLLAALVTVSWGGLAMVASIPMNWFFSTAIPHSGFVMFVNFVVFAGVGVAMTDTFWRVMHRIDPAHSSRAVWWIGLVGVIGAEFFYALDLFHFAGV